MKTNCFLNNFGFVEHPQLISNKFTDEEIDVIKKNMERFIRKIKTK